MHGKQTLIVGGLTHERSLSGGSAVSQHIDLRSAASYDRNCDMANGKPMLDLGRLLRVQAMVTEVAQTTATFRASNALVRAYLRLREEIIGALAEAEGLEELRAEAERLFPILDEASRNNQGRMEEATAAALINIRQIGGWVQGLIDEQTLERRMRMEAEERAKLAARSAPGFTA